MQAMWCSGDTRISLGAVVDELMPAADAIGSEALVPADLLSKPVRIYTTQFGGDATNGNIWQNRALHNTKSSTAWIAVEGDDAVRLMEQGGSTWWNDLVHFTTDYGDVQAVTDKTGRGCAAMMTKQFHSIGCPTWQDIVDAIHTGKTDEFDHFILLATADDGPDQNYCRTLNLNAPIGQ